MKLIIEIAKWLIAFVLFIGSLLIAGFIAGLLYCAVRDGFRFALHLFPS